MGQHEEISIVGSDIIQEENASAITNNTLHESGGIVKDVTCQDTNGSVHSGYSTAELRFAEAIDDIMTHEGSPWAYQYWSTERAMDLPHISSIPHIREQLRSETSDASTIQMAGRTYVNMDTVLGLLRDHIYKAN